MVYRDRGDGWYIVNGDCSHGVSFPSFNCYQWLQYQVRVYALVVVPLQRSDNVYDYCVELLVSDTVVLALGRC